MSNFGKVILFSIKLISEFVLTVFDVLMCFLCCIFYYVLNFIIVKYYVKVSSCLLNKIKDCDIKETFTQNALCLEHCTTLFKIESIEHAFYMHLSQFKNKYLLKMENCVFLCAVFHYWNHLNFCYALSIYCCWKVYFTSFNITFCIHS